MSDFRENNLVGPTLSWHFLNAAANIYFQVYQGECRAPLL